MEERPGEAGPWAGAGILLVERDPRLLEVAERAVWRLGVETIATVANEGDAREFIRLKRPSLALVRSELVERDGDGGRGFIVDALALARELKLIVVGESVDERVRTAFFAGALAYLLPDASWEDVAWTIRQVFRRTVYVAERPLGGVEAWPDTPDLTAREQQVLALVVDGHGNKAIAFRLAISEETVKFHLSNIFRKLNVTNRTGASREAHRLGLLERAG